MARRPSTAWVIAGVALALFGTAGGLWLHKLLRIPVASEAFAPLRPCGPEPTAIPAADTPAAAELLMPNLEPALAGVAKRALLATPPVIRDALLAAHYTVGVVEGKKLPRECRPRPDSAPAAAGTAATANGSGDDATGTFAACTTTALVSVEGGTASTIMVGLPNNQADDPDWRERGTHQAMLPVLTHVYLTDLLVPALRNDPVSKDEISLPAALRAAMRQLAEALHGTGDDDRELRQRFGQRWAEQVEPVERAVDFTTDWFYCSPESRKKLHELHASAEAVYARTLQCVFGRPWYASEAEYTATCAGSH